VIVTLRFGVTTAMALAFGGALRPLLASRSPGGWPDPRWPVVLPSSVALVLSLLSLLWLTATMAGAPAFPVDGAMLSIVVGETALGTSFLVRFAALAATIVIAISGGTVAGARRGPLVATSGVALATLAWTGHAVADDGIRGWLHLVADIVHLLAAGAWIGAIAVLLSLIPGRSSGGQRSPALRPALASFATTGTILVASVVVTGVINGWAILGRDGLGRSLQTMYGVLLACKILLFVLMLVIASANRWVLTPWLAEATKTGDTECATAWLRVSLRAELLCACAIIALVAWLGTLAPTG